jgi:hypothetical protein
LSCEEFNKIVLPELMADRGNARRCGVLDKDSADLANHIGVLDTHVARPDHHLRPRSAEPGAQDWHKTVGCPIGRWVADGCDDRVERERLSATGPF